MEIWVTVIAAVIAATSAIVVQKVANSSAKHQLDALKLVRDAQIATASGAVSTHLAAAELHLAKRIEVRYRSYGVVSSLAVGTMIGTFVASILLLIVSLVVTIFAPSIQDVVGYWLNLIAIGLLAVGLVAAWIVVAKQLEASKALDKEAAGIVRPNAGAEKKGDQKSRRSLFGVKKVSVNKGADSKAPLQNHTKG